MPTPETPAAPFTCPACGQKHRADLSALAGKPGAALKTACKGCSKPLAVSLDAQGQPACVLAEAAAAPQAPVSRTPAPKASEPKAGESRTAPAPTKAAAPKATAPAASKAAAPAPRSAREKRQDEAKAREEAPALEAEFAAGAEVGRYRIEEVVGQGGTGTVYRAFDPTTNRSVALKVLLKDVSEGMRQRFVREIEVQANIRHPHIMPVFDRGELPDGRPFFTMELLYKPFTLTDIVERRERGTLARYATLAPLGQIEKLVTDVIVPVAEGLYVANVENGVIHRDLKPDNVLVDSRTLRPYVIDFGICSVLDKAGKLSGGVVVSPTAEDAGIVGTPRFLAPEQARGSVGPRTDVWGLGALLHFCVTGEPPIAPATGITRAELKGRIEALKEARDAALAAENDKRVELADEKLARLQDPGLRTLDDMFRDAREGRYPPLPSSTPSALAAVVRKAMSVEPGDRYVNVRQVAGELTSWVEGARVRALSEAGGADAAVDSAKRAIRHSWVPVAAAAAGLVVGLLVGGSYSRILRTSSGDALAGLQASIGAFKREVDTAQVEGEAAVGAEAARLYRVLAQRAEGLRQAIGEEPPGSSRDSLLEQFGYQAQRVAPSRVRLAAPAGYDAWVAERQGPLGRERVELKPGDENLLPPGDWTVLGAVREGEALRERVRVPLRLPFVVRKEGVAASREAPAAAVEVPLAPAQVPEGMVLVVGGSLRLRQPPYADASAAPTTVKSFLLGRTEVSNSEYAQWLATLPEAEAQQRMPSVGFVRDPSASRPALVRGGENLPVVGVRPQDARAYAAWRGKRDGATVRVASEAEWMLAAGAAAGWVLPGGREGSSSDGVFQVAFGPVGAHPVDVGPHGVQGLLGNARELVEPVEGSVPSGGMLVKGAGLGDAPSAGATGLVRVQEAHERHPTTGFRLARDI